MDVGIILLFVAALLFYFLPALVARSRDHPNREAIFVLNLLLGWSVIGWAVALVWAFTSSPADATPAEAPSLRTCPYCAESIQPNAIKCRHCGSDLVTDPRALLMHRD